MRASSKHTKLNSDKGFTLVELIVVIIISMILAGAIAVGVTQWISRTHYKEQDEYASVLFLAAQTQLSSYKASGRLPEKCQILMEEEGSLKRGLSIPLTTYAGQKALDLIPITADSADKRVKLNELWPGSNGKENYQEEVCSLIGTVETYELYQKQKKGEALTDSEKAVLTEETLLLYDILVPYVYDPSILKANICLEFTPTDGQVYALLYSNDKKNAYFTYEKEDQYTKPEDAALKGKTSIFDRRIEALKKRYIGFYGVDTLSKAANTNALKPALSDVILHNEDTLNLTFRLSKVKDALKLLTYTVEVHDYATGATRLQIRIDLTKIENPEDLSRQQMQTKQPVMGLVTRYSEDGTRLDSTPLELPFLFWVEENYTCRLVLDAADAGALGSDYMLARGKLSAPDYATVANDDIKMNCADPFLQTFSFHRFGINSEDVYCTVQCSGATYKSSNSKKSNHDAVYFAKVGSSTAGAQTIKNYEIKNGRHLYNIRFVEDCVGFTVGAEGAALAEAADILRNYYLTADIDWAEFAKDSFYDTKRTEGRKTAPVGDLHEFASISKLSENSTFTSKAGVLSQTKYKLSGLRLSESTNLTDKGYVFLNAEGKYQYATEGPVGLFATNMGTIQNVCLEKLTVKGNKQVGGFCGYNRGTLAYLTVGTAKEEEGSTVTGVWDVGGVFGASALEENVTKNYRNLTNYASVCGTRYVGGITGRVLAKKSTVILEDCVNYGAIEAEVFDDEGNVIQLDLTAENPSAEQLALRYSMRYLGGITGLCFLVNEGVAPEEMGELKLVNCVSSPQYTEATLNEMGILNSTQSSMTPEAESALAKRLKGSFVGGIVGYNHEGTIENCRTEKHGNSNGYIFGANYVGGIVGFNESANVPLDGKQGINEIHVIGDTYVGGIAGSNGSLENAVLDAAGEDTDSVWTACPVMNPLRAAQGFEKQIVKWTNRGVVAATGNYAGGIVGFNTGILLDCKSEVNSSETANKISSAQSLKGSYIGGIAGYNNGSIKASGTELISAISYVTGKNYIGGIVGYNDVDAVVDGYRLNGGFIRGNGVFVGGYAGLNASVALVAGKNVESNPNQVTGSYCVGGTIGGNLLVTNQDVTVALSTNNFLGNMSAKAICGGFIGYHQFIEYTAADTRETCAGKVMTLAEKLVALDALTYESLPEKYQIDLTLLQQSELANKKEVQVLSAVKDRLNTITAENPDSPATLTITSQSGIQESRLGGVTAEIYVGGVVGISADDSKLTLKNILNRTPVQATMAIPNPAENPDNKGEAATGYKDFVYSYAGGVVGKVGKLVIVENCRNYDVGDVVSAGTVLGGLCELNEGQIINCTVSNMGSAGKNYIGGIAGINKKGGIITGTYAENVTITGGRYVGGIAAENYGTIVVQNGKNGKIEGLSINAEGDYIGGIAGVNYNAILMTQGELGTNKAQATVTVNSKGKYVGGVCGANSGSITNILSEKYTIKGIVLGDAYVGGIVGENDGANIVLGQDTLLKLQNEAFVSAKNGICGGIAGNSLANINQCDNYGHVEATKTGDCGGIVANNTRTIKNCRNFGDILSQNGSAGAITAWNKKEGRIEDCQVLGAAGQPLTCSAYGNVGGVCAKNEGTIVKTSVSQVKVCNTQASTVSNIGLIAGINTGLIGTQATAGAAKDIVISDSEAFTYSREGNVGGAVGTNSCKDNGTATAQSIELRNVLVYLAGFDEKAESIAKQYVNCKVAYARLGGLVGINEVGAQLKNSSSNANVYGYRGYNGYAYSGICAVNNGLIDYCIFNGDLKANGDSSAEVVMGGIAGIHGEKGIISNCLIGTVESDTYTINPGTNAVTKVGGIAGECYGEIRSCDNAAGSKGTVNILSYKGYVGGITSYLHENGKIQGTKEIPVSTGKKWSIKLNECINDAGAGGIVGYSKSGEDILYAINNASVTAPNKDNMATGGIIGRLENRFEMNMQIAYCENNGDITGGVVAGIVARPKYKGSYIYNCINRGTLKCLSNAAGGIIGSIYMSDTETIIEHCTNYGYIYGVGAGAGIVADFDTSKIVRMVDCVNVGNIDTTGNCAGISSGKINSAMAEIYNCRNYGNSTNQNFYGIESKTATRKLINAFSAGTAKGNSFLPVPVGFNSSYAQNLYYLAPAENKDAGTDYRFAPTILTLSGYSYTDSNHNQENLCKPTEGVADKNHRVGISVNKNYGDNNYFAVLFADAYAFTKVDVWFANDNSGTPAYSREYHFKVAITDGNNVKHWLAKNENGTQEWSVDSKDAIECSVIAPNDAVGAAFSILPGDISVNSVLFYVKHVDDLVNTGKIERNWLMLDKVVVSSETVSDLMITQKSSQMSNLGIHMIEQQAADATYRLIHNSEQNKTDSFTAVIEPLTQKPSGIWSDMTPAGADRIAVYEELDPKVIDFLRLKMQENADISSVSVTYGKQLMNVTWKHASGGYYEDVVVYRIKEDDKWPDTFTALTYVSMGTESLQIPVQEEWYGKQIQVAVCSINGSFEKTEGQTDVPASGNAPKKFDQNSSAWKCIQSVVKPPMPTPRVHMELGATDADGNTNPENFVLILDNPEDYNTTDKNASIYTEVVYAGGTQKITFSSETGRSQGFALRGNGDQFIRSCALENTTYAASITVITQYWLVGTLNTGNTPCLSDNKIIRTEFGSFYGDRSSTLYYALKLYNSPERINTEHYINSELVIRNYALTDTVKIDLVTSSGYSHKTMKETYLNVELGNLPEELISGGDGITIRTYPWACQSNVILYGHMVKTGLDRDSLGRELTTLTDLERTDEQGNARAVYDAAAEKLNPGYVVRLNDEGTYDIFYSAFLGNPELYRKQIDQMVFEIDQSNSSAWTLTNGTVRIPILQAPVIEDTYPLYDPDGVDYTFTWDRGKGNAGAIYDLKLYAYSEDGSQVLLDQKTTDASYYDAASDLWKYCISDTDDTWAYPEMKLQLERVGTMDGAGKTTTLPYQSEQTFAIKLRHTRVAQPTIVLMQSDNSTAVKNSLTYQVSWDSVPTKEWNNTGEEAVHNLTGYRILIRPDGEGYQQHFTDEASLSRTFEAAKAFYAGKTGVTVEEISEEKFVYTWQESGTIEGSTYPYIVTKSMTLTKNWIANTDQQEGVLTRYQMQSWYYERPTHGGTIKRLINLDEYERNETLLVMIQAIANTDEACRYRNGLLGVSRSFTIPNRLVVPDVTGLEGLPAYAADQAISIEELANGITIRYQDAQANTMQGHYQIAVAVSEAASESDTGKHASGDAQNAEDIGYWNSSVSRTILTKEAQTAMYGDFVNSTLTLKNFGIEDAGRYLKIALRSVSESNISSWWSDEDEALDATENYGYVRLPRVQLETPKLTASQTQVYYSPEGEWSLEASPVRKQLGQTTLSLDVDPYADLYVFTCVRKEKQTLNQTATRSEVDWIYLVRRTNPDGSDSFAIYMQSTQEDFPLQLGGTPTTIEGFPEDGMLLYEIGNSADAECIALPTVQQVQYSQLDQGVSVGLLCFSYDENQMHTTKIRLVLPDAEEIADYTDEDSKNLLTAQVSVQALVKDTNQEFYADSERINWYRYTENGLQKQAQCLAAQTAASSTDTIQIAPSMSANVAYDAFITGTGRVLKLTLQDAAGNTKYVSYCAADQLSNDSAVFTLSDAAYAKWNPVEDAPNVLKIQGAQIHETGNISYWSEEISVEMPILTVQPIALTQSDETVNVSGTVSITREGDAGDVLQTLQMNGRKYTFAADPEGKIKAVILKIGENSMTLAYRADEQKWYIGENPVTDEVSEGMELSALLTETLSGSDWVAYAQENAEIKAKCTLQLADQQVICCIPYGDGTCVIDDREQYRYTFSDTLEILTVPENEYYRIAQNTQSGD